MFRPLLTTVLLVSFAAARPQADEPARGAQSVVVTDYERLLQANFEALGGVELLASLNSLKFTVSASVFEVPEGAEEGTEPVEVPAQEVQVEMELGQRPPRQRHEKEYDGLPLVQTVSPEGQRVWVDGQESSLPGLQRAALEQATLFSLHFGQLLGLATGGLTGSLDRVRTRDGVAYRAIEAKFHPTRGISSPLRLYFHPETNLIERIDIFDAESRRRIQSVLLREYASVDGLMLPCRADFLDREGRIELRWRFTDLAMNPEIDPERFEGP